MKKIILFCLLASSHAFSEEHDHEQFLLQAVKIGNQIQEQTKDKTLVEKISFTEGFAKDFSNNPIALDIIMQGLSVEYSFAGLHSNALITRDRTAEVESSNVEDLANYNAKSAVVEILEQNKVPSTLVESLQILN